MHTAAGRGPEPMRFARMTCCPSRCWRARAGHAQPDHALRKTHRFREVRRPGPVGRQRDPAVEQSLTVILGYATLLQESATIDEPERKAVDSIVSESRRIRATLESLSRVSYERGDLPAAISVTELLGDMEQLYRAEFLQRSIEFQVNVAPGCRAFCAERSSCARPFCIACNMPFTPWSASTKRSSRMGPGPFALRRAGKAIWCRSRSATPGPAFSTRARLRPLCSRTGRRRDTRHWSQPLRLHPARSERPDPSQKPRTQRRSHHSRPAGGMGSAAEAAMGLRFASP